MTIPLANQIEAAEHDLTPSESHQPERHPGPSLREAGAQAIRSSAMLGLRLADRLDPHHHAITA